MISYQCFDAEEDSHVDRDEEEEEGDGDAGVVLALQGLQVRIVNQGPKILLVFKGPIMSESTCGPVSHS